MTLEGNIRVYKVTYLPNGYGAVKGWLHMTLLNNPRLTMRRPLDQLLRWLLPSYYLLSTLLVGCEECFSSWCIFRGHLHGASTHRHCSRLSLSPMSCYLQTKTYALSLIFCFRAVVLQAGFMESCQEFFLCSRDMVLLLLYVDVMIITRDDVDEIRFMKYLIFYDNSRWMI